MAEDKYELPDVVEALTEWEKTGVYPDRIEDMADYFLGQLGLKRPAPPAADGSSEAGS